MKGVKAARCDNPHVVVKDDTLAELAKPYGLSADEAAIINGLANKDEIEVGQKLCFPTQPTPAATTKPCTCRTLYTVSDGEQLWRIANKYGTTPYAIKNCTPSVINIDVIHPGQQLCIP